MGSCCSIDIAMSYLLDTYYVTLSWTCKLMWQYFVEIMKHTCKAVISCHMSALLHKTNCKTRFCYLFCYSYRVLLFTITTSSNVAALWYAVYDVYQLLHVSTLTCHRHGAIIRRYISQHENLCSASLCNNDKYLRMLKYTKLTTINYIVMLLNIKIFNHKPPQLSVLSFCIMRST